VLVPAAVNAASGYRFYSPGQLPEAALIDALRRTGMPLADIHAVMRHPSADLLDDWATHLEIDASARRDALQRARRLLASSSNPSSSTGPGRSGPWPSDLRGNAMKLTVAGRTDTGRVRERNEDAAMAGLDLAGVADGLGGAPGGRLAAELAVSVVQASFTGQSADGLAAAVRAANRAIWEHARAAEDLAGMGTTICAAGLVRDATLVVAHVGDSRTYLCHNGTVTRLTQDHSVVADLVRRGEITEQEAPGHPQRAVLTRALGVGPDVEVEVTVQAAMPGDRLLLCTDGLFTEVSEEDIAASMTDGTDLQAAADRLIELALAAGAADNVSVVLAQIDT
jgi:protein phosphatase